MPWQSGMTTAHRTTGFPWTDELVCKAQRMRDDGATYDRIGADLGCSGDAVKHKLCRARQSDRRSTAGRRWSEAADAMLLEQTGRGVNYREAVAKIARELGEHHTENAAASRINTLRTMGVDVPYSPRFFDRRHDAELARLAATMTLTELSRHFGKHRDTIERHLKRLGVQIRDAAPKATWTPPVRDLTPCEVERASAGVNPLPAFHPIAVAVLTGAPA